MLGLCNASMYRGRETDATRPIYNKYAVGIWDINKSIIRLRRDDDDFEKEFSPLAGRILDVNSITNFFEWNLLNGAEYKDYLYDVPLGVDSDDNGISDEWTTGIPGGQSATFSVSDNAQVVEITASTNTNAVEVFSPTISVLPAEVFSAKLKLKKSSNVRVRLDINFYLNGSYVRTAVGTNIFDEEFVDTYNVDATVAGSGENEIKLSLKVIPTSTGDTGFGYFKEAILVKNDFIEDIGLLTQDDDSNGIANGWVENNPTAANITIVRSVVDEQIINISSSTANDDRGGIQITIPVQASSSYTLLVDKKVSDIVGNFVGRVIAQLDNKGLLQDETFTNTDYESLVYSFTTNASDTELTIYIQGKANVGGATGIAYFKNATLKQTNNSSYVSKITDYTGNGNDATQTSSASQPRLVNAGVFEVDADNGEIMLDYNGTSQYFEVDNSFFNNHDELTYVVVCNLPNTNSDDALIGERSSDTAKNNGLLKIGANLSSNRVFLRADDNIADISFDNVGSPFNNNYIVNIYVFKQDNFKLYTNGSLIEDLDYTKGSYDINKTWIGAVRASGTSTITDFIDGHITSVSIFNKALTESQIKLLSDRLA